VADHPQPAGETFWPVDEAAERWEAMWGGSGKQKRNSERPVRYSIMTRRRTRSLQIALHAGLHKFLYRHSNRNFLSFKDLKMGATGLEPVTPSVSSGKNSSLASVATARSNTT